MKVTIGLTGVIEWLDDLDEDSVHSDATYEHLLSKIRQYELPLAVFENAGQWVIALDERYAGKSLIDSYWLNSFVERDRTYEWIRFAIHPTFTNWTLVGKCMLNMI